MAKFYGNIGYGVSAETRPGVWDEIITEKPYYGDVNKLSRRLRTDDKVVDDINIANEISILADPFAYENFSTIKYVEYMGAKWKVTKVEVKYPRLTIMTGGVYNGQ